MSDDRAATADLQDEHAVDADQRTRQSVALAIRIVGPPDGGSIGNLE